MSDSKSEKPNMPGGGLYDASDTVPVQEHKKVLSLTHRLNVTQYGDEHAYRQFISSLLLNGFTDTTSQFNKNNIYHRFALIKTCAYFCDCVQLCKVSDHRQCHYFPGDRRYPGINNSRVERSQAPILQK